MNSQDLIKAGLPVDFGPKHPNYKFASFRNRYLALLNKTGEDLPQNNKVPAAAVPISMALNLRRCSRVGIDVTRRCNFKCKTCFYRWHPSFGTTFDVPIEDALTQARNAKARGCDHVVLIGWGEPCLWKPLLEYIRELVSMGMTSSIITNGSLPVTLYASLREAGLNHLHISVHGLGDVLDRIVEFPGAGARQMDLMRWLKEESWPWRMNMTAQLENYQSMPSIAATCIMNGCRHIISLGFLPHYEWNAPEKLRQVAVHPAELTPYIEKTHDIVKRFSDVMFTIRYHPMCLLRPESRPYVVNAQYVLYDPWEWEYIHLGEKNDVFWRSAQAMGGSVAITEEPCRSCGLKIHCGGWNKVYCRGFGEPKDILRGIVEPGPARYTAGYYHVQNPANLEKGWF